MAPSPLHVMMMISGAAALWSDGDLGVSNNGETVATLPLPRNSTADCFAACLARPDCAAWEVRFASAACAASATCALKSSFGGAGAETYLGARVPCALDGCAASGPVARAAASPLLQPLAFAPARLSAVSPAGWLAAALAQQAATGQTGQLALFWPPVNASVWLGGDADGYLHEDAPYFLAGAVPLAALLRNAGLPDPHDVGGQVRAALARIVANQSASGWLGPDDTHSGDQYWARYNVIAAFLQQADGEPAAAAALIPAALRYVAAATRRALQPTGSYQINDWSAARAHDFLLSLYFLLDHFDEYAAAGLVPAGISEATLYNAAAVAHAQALGNGAVWEEYFSSADFPNSTVTQNFGMLDHGVNVQQAIKTGGVWWRQLANASLVDSTHERLRVLDLYHGSPSGVVQADEHLAGKEPQHGTELCGIVEAMYSFEVLGDILGEPIFYDRAERAAYNALPGAMTKDQSAHNYLSSSNEVQAAVSDPHIWLTDGPYAEIYGLAPNFGCCTANHHQGWPRFAARLHKTTPDGGVAVTLWAPGTTALQLAGGGGATTVAVETTYPFGDDAVVTVSAPVGTPVRLRVPGWAGGAARVCVAGGACSALANGTFFLTLQATAVATYTVDFAPAVVVDATYFAGSAAVYRGALLYALAIGENVTTIASGPRGFDDYSVHPTSAWNVALQVDPANPAAALTFARAGPPGPSPFGSVTQTLTGVGVLLPGWVMFNNSAASPPPSPVDCGQAGACGDRINITLVPYGTTLLRVAALPWLLPPASGEAAAFEEHI